MRKRSGMKLGLDISPDLVAVMATEVKAGEKAVSAAMREAGTDLKTAWRGQITQAGLGRRLSNSIRSQIYPKAGESLKAAALIWSKAPVIVGAHDTGSLIRSKDAFWLAIPTPAAGRGLRGGRITPGEWERRRGLPNVKWLLGDRGYDADWFREALKDKGIRACIPGRKQRKTTVKYDKRRYKRRNRIEIMFGRLKDWRRVATRYDRCPKVFRSAFPENNLFEVSEILHVFAQD